MSPVTIRILSVAAELGPGMRWPGPAHLMRAERLKYRRVWPIQAKMVFIGMVPARCIDLGLT
jgi:hypothetical protein